MIFTLRHFRSPRRKRFQSPRRSRRTRAETLATQADNSEVKLAKIQNLRSWWFSTFSVFSLLRLPWHRNGQIMCIIRHDLIIIRIIIIIIIIIIIVLLFLDFFTVFLAYMQQGKKYNKRQTWQCEFCTYLSSILVFYKRIGSDWRKGEVWVTLVTQGFSAVLFG